MTFMVDAPSVTVSGVHHAYETAPVLHDVSVDIAPGQSLALLGPSGCGKTTLLRLIAGLEHPLHGSVMIGDTCVAGNGQWVPPERRRVGMVFQDWALFPHLDVETNVAYGLRRSDRKSNRVSEALELVGLNDLGGRMPETLSGGQQQRVALARALAPQPAVLLLDEPFSNLDTALRIEVRTDVHRLLHELGITAVFVTHDQEEAFVLGDQVAVMRDGRIVQVDTPQGLYTEPADRAVAEFVGAGSLIRSTAANGKAESPCGPINVRIEQGPIDILFRPEQLTLLNHGDLTVDLVEYYGHDVMVFVRTQPGDDGASNLLRVRCDPNANVRRGDKVGLSFTGETAVAFPA
ncbi:MAG: ABC transporter ATP-binding protein [Acidimicrobiales bacterium]|jgi:iron(III) transport system ATP-binding protein